MAKASTRERFLAATAGLLRRQGYSGTGLKQVALAAAAPWGSLYHFFPGGKEQLGAEAVLAAAEAYGAAIKGLFESVENPASAVRLMFRHEVEVLERSNYRDGCPVASTAIDVASTSDLMRQACSDAFVQWHQLVAGAFVRAGVDLEEADACAAFSLAALEGAIILARTHRSTVALKQTGSMTEAALRAAATALASRSPSSQPRLDRHAQRF